MRTRVALKEEKELVRDWLRLALSSEGLLLCARDALREEEEEEALGNWYRLAFSSEGLLDILVPAATDGEVVFGRE